MQSLSSPVVSTRSVVDGEGMHFRGVDAGIVGSHVIDIVRRQFLFAIGDIMAFEDASALKETTAA